ncbi:hypothetical protein J7K50_01725 [bacterium]|nr:hypothetical protein [bacterium]
MAYANGNGLRLAFFMPALFFAVLIVLSCGGGGTGKSNIGGPSAPAAPVEEGEGVTINPVTSDEVPATDGAIESSVTAYDSESGTSAFIPYGTTVATSDPQYDTDGDGYADTFAVSISELDPAAAAISIGSADEGITFEQISTAGGATFAPEDAVLSYNAALTIPVYLGSDIGAGVEVEAWRFTDSKTTSSLGGSYWSYLDVFVTENLEGNTVVKIRTNRLGSFAITIPESINHAPEFTAISANPYTIIIGGISNLNASAYDPDGDTITYTWSGEGVFGSTGNNETTWTHDITGRFTLTCTVADPGGKVAYNIVNITVVEPPVNLAPVITEISAVPAEIMVGETVQLNAIATDPEDDPLTYAWTGEGVFTDPGHAETEWTHDAPGEYGLTCTVEDTAGNSASDIVVVTVNPPPDTTAPEFAGGSADFTAEARESFILVSFNEATDTESPPVSYTVLYDEAAVFDEATATALEFDSYPTQPVRIDGLTLGTSYTIGVIATDSADTPNSTVTVTADATPLPYFDEVPSGDHSFDSSVISFDVSAAPYGLRNLDVVWPDPASGTLRHSYYTDDAWVVRDISSDRNFVLAQVFFTGNLPSVVAADDAGNLDILVENADGSWTSTNIFSNVGIIHAVLDALFDPTSGMLYIGHATEPAVSPTEQTLHFLAVDMSGETPVVIDDIRSHISAPKVGQVHIRLDSAGNPFMIFSYGDGAFRFPNWLDTSIEFASYDPVSGLTSEAVTAFNPLFFDVRAASGGGWELAVSHGEMVVYGSQDFIATELLLATGSGATWAITGVFAEQLNLVEAVLSYEAPLECVLDTTPGAVYFTCGSGTIEFPVLTSTANLSLWHAIPPAERTAETGNSISRLKPFSTSGGAFLLGTEVVSFDFEAIENQLGFPDGNLVLREIL